MRTLARVMLVALLGVGLASCAESSARSAVEDAESRIAAIQDEASKIEPDRLAAITDSLESAKTRLGEGDFRAVVMSARSVSAIARDLEATMGNTKSQLETAFSSAAGELPDQLETILTRIGEVASLRRLPTSVDPARFQALQEKSAGWTDSWNQAKADYEAGYLAKAMAVVNTLRVSFREATNLIGS